MGYFLPRSNDPNIAWHHVRALQGLLHRISKTNCNLSSNPVVFRLDHPMFLRRDTLISTQLMIRPVLPRPRR